MLVVDILSRKSIHTATMMLKKWQLIEDFRNLDLPLCEWKRIHSDLENHIQEASFSNKFLSEVRD